MVDYGDYYKRMQSVSDAQRQQRAAADVQARKDVNNLVGGVETEAFANADKGINADPTKTDITTYGSYAGARDAYQKQRTQQALGQGTAGSWEKGWNQRQAGEAADPWSQLSSRLGAVQQQSAQRNVNMQQKQRAADESQARADFNAKQQALRNNDGDNKRKYDEQQRAWNAALDKYQQQADTQASLRNYTGITVSPYGSALRDCQTGKGPCPPDATLLQVNQATANGKMTDAQEALKRRLSDISTKYENPGFAYGTGTDLAGF